MKPAACLIALLLTLSSAACAIPTPRHSFQPQGATSIRVAQSVWSDDRLDSTSIITRAEDIHSTELQVEHAVEDGLSLVAGIGTRNYQFEELDDFQTFETTLGFRSYALPFHEHLIGYFGLGARYGDLPGSEYSVDIDSSFGLVVPFESLHLDINLTSGLSVAGDGDIPFLENFERNHLLLSIGVGWSFGSGN